MRKYQIIYADPPWEQRKGGKRKIAPNQGRELDYPTLSLEEIRSHLSQIIINHAEPNNVLFLWTIDKYLHEAEVLVVSLGYKLHARMIWNKEKGVAPGFTVRFGHEYLLWLYKGKFTPIAKDQRGKQLTVFSEKSTIHSKKPEIAYQIIEKFFPETAKLEMYARNKRTGWDSWGNEVENDINITNKEDLMIKKDY